MSFLRTLFGLDTSSCVARGDAYGKSGEWGLAHMEYEKALAALDAESASLRPGVEEKRAAAAEQLYARNLERARTATELGDLDEAVAYIAGAMDVLPEGDGRRADLGGRLDDLRMRLDEASLKEEISAFLEGQGTAEFARQRRQWEFSMYFINTSDEDLDDSEKYTTLDLIELAGELDENPDDPNRLVNLGMALAQSGFSRRAIAPLRRAAELRPDDKEVHYLLGNLYADEGHLDLAVAAFDRAIELDPGFALAYLYLGRTYLKAGDDEEAARLLEKAATCGTDESGVPEEARELLQEIAERRAPGGDTPESLEERIP